MMKEFEIDGSVDEEGFKRHFDVFRSGKSHRILYGSIFRVLLGGEYYPDPEWEESPLVIVSGWLEKFVRLLERGHIECYFIMGDCTMPLVLASDPSRVLVSFYEDDEPKTYLVQDVEVPLNLVVHELIRNAENLIRIFYLFAKDETEADSDFKYLFRWLPELKRVWSEYAERHGIPPVQE